MKAMTRISIAEDGTGIDIDTKVDQYYTQFLLREYCPRTYLVVVSLTALYAACTIYKLSNANHLSPFYVAPIQLLLVAVVVDMVLVWMYKPSAREDGETDLNSCDCRAWYVQLLQVISAPMMAVALAGAVVLELQGKACAEESVVTFLMPGLRTFPFLVMYTLRDTNFASILFGIGTCAVMLFVISVHSQGDSRFAELLTYVSSVAVYLYDVVGQTRSVRKLIAEFHQTLAENEKLAVEAQALELRAMIGNVAHDLKTPLTSFLSGIECMTEVVTGWARVVNGTADEGTGSCMAKCKEAIAVLQKCLKTMQGTNSFMTMTINRCIDYTKASKGVKLVPKPETAELQAQLEMPVDLMRTVQSAVEVKLAPISAEICTHVITDQQWLMENVLCLLSNAVKYSHKGTVEVGVSLEGAASEPQCLRFEVQDTGVGLSEEAMQTLFNPFKQAQRLAGGTGLGLFSLAKRAEALHGRYGVTKRVDGAQGSVFWFTIPYRPDLLSARMAKVPKPYFAAITKSVVDNNATASEAQGKDDDGRSERVHSVLVVDDAPMIVKMTSMLLKRKGHAVESAVNGAEALEKLLQGYETARSSASAIITAPYDVVLMDLQMPVLDGVEAVRRLRAAEGEFASVDFEKADEGGAKRPAPRQLVIALSANSDDETRNAALEAGADAFMAKPFTYESFAKLLQEKGCT